MENATRIFVMLGVLSIFYSALALNQTGNSSSEATNNYYINEQLLHRTLDSLANCRFETLKSDEYELLPNGSLEVYPYELILNKTYFDLWKDSATVCVPKDAQDGRYVMSVRGAYVLPHLISMSTLLVVLLLASILDTERLILGTYTLVFAYLLISAFDAFFGGFPVLSIGEFMVSRGYFFTFTAFYFWMSAIAADCLMAYKRKCTSQAIFGYEADMRMFPFIIKTIPKSVVRMMIVLNISLALDFFLIPLEPEFESETEKNIFFYVRPVLGHAVERFFNLFHVLCFLYRRNSSHKMHKYLKFLYWTNFTLFSVMTFSWFLGFRLIFSNVIFSRTFVFSFQMHIVNLFVVIAASVRLITFVWERHRHATPDARI